MKELVLSRSESQELLEKGSVEIEKNGFPIHIEKNDYFDETKEESWSNRKYNITIINTFEKVVVEEKKIITKTILAAKFESKKMHLYDVKTTGKHPVHMIEGGEYLTEDESIFNVYSDLGWFFLNQKEYDYFKSQIKEVTIEINA